MIKILITLLLFWAATLYGQTSSSLSTSSALGGSIDQSKEIQKKKTTIAVLEISGDALSKSAKSGLTSIVERGIHKYKDEFELLERANMQAIMNEQGFQQGAGCTTEQCAVEMGQVLGVNDMVFGEVEKIGSLYLVTIKNVDVENGKIKRIVTDEYKGDEEGLVEVFKKLTPQIIGKTEPVNIVEKKETVSSSNIVKSNELKPNDEKSVESSRLNRRVKATSEEVIQKKETVNKVVPKKDKTMRRWLDIYFGVGLPLLMNNNYIDGDEPFDATDYSLLGVFSEFGVNFYLLNSVAVVYSYKSYSVKNSFTESYDLFDSYSGYVLSTDISVDLSEEIYLSHLGLRFIAPKMQTYFEIDYAWGTWQRDLTNDGYIDFDNVPYGKYETDLGGVYFEIGKDFIYKYLGFNMNMGMGIVGGTYNTVPDDNTTDEVVTYLYPTFGIRVFLAGISYK